MSKRGAEGGERKRQQPRVEHVALYDIFIIMHNNLSTIVLYLVLFFPQWDLCNADIDVIRESAAENSCIGKKVEKVALIEIL